MTSSDYSDAEMRVLVHIHPLIGKAVGTFDAATGQPTDLARIRAAQIFKVPEASVTAAQRDYAKQQLYAELYGRHTEVYGQGAKAQNTQGPNTGRQNSQNAWYNQYNTANRWRR